MTVVGKLAEGRLEDNTEDVIEGHDDTDEKGNKREAACSGNCALSLSLGKFADPRNCICKRCAEICDKFTLRKNLVDFCCAGLDCTNEVAFSCCCNFNSNVTCCCCRNCVCCACTNLYAVDFPDIIIDKIAEEEEALCVGLLQEQLLYLLLSSFLYLP